MERLEKVMLDIPKIEAVLHQARRWDMDFPLFGSHSHAHLFQPPLPVEDAEAWEELMEVRLPEDYRLYLTRLGNGGAGPAYGIASFRCPLQDCLREPAVFSDDQEERFNDLARRWYAYSNEDEDQLYRAYCEQTSEERRMNCCDWSEARYRFVEKTVIHFLFKSGQLFIANQGCSQDIYLLLSGSHRGFCHGSSEEYDYSYPFWYQPSNRRAAITWPRYRETLTTFSDYFMDYVNRVEQVCRELTGEKRQQFFREQAQARNFQSAVEAKDWAAALIMLTGLEPAALSIKSRSFYLYYKKTLKEHLPDRPEVPLFFQKVDKTRRCSAGAEFTCFWSEEDSEDDCPSPHFSDFLETFTETEQRRT